MVTPADQTVANPEAFTLAMHHAIQRAQAGGIVILGIQPDRPETGYGYIKAISSEIQGSAAKVEKFVEKPNSETAQRYLAEGGYYWKACLYVEIN